MNLDAQLYEQYVRDCLAHLYDHTFLQEHPLTRLLFPNAQGSTNRVQAFRDMVFEAIERLKPGADDDGQTKNGRLYHILMLRYQKQQQVQYVLHKLNLGERQFYRDHAKAVHAIAQILEQRLNETAYVPETLSIYSEIQRVHRLNLLRDTNSEDFLQKALYTIKGLRDKYQADITLRRVDQNLPLTVDQTLLRQVIIWIVSQQIMESPPGSHFDISFEVKDYEARFIFEKESQVTAEGHPAHESQETLQALVSALGATVFERQNHAQRAAIVLNIPLRHRAILVVDDNPDAIALFQQYLIGQPYQLVAAADGQQAIEFARESHPDFIILDVLLPNQDGWETLQNLKSHPATLDTPVLICSVLDAGELAMLLGADGFLHKPPTEQEFLQVLERFGQ